MLNLLCPLSGLETSAIQVLTTADNLSVRVCVLPVMSILLVLAEDFFGKLGLNRGFFFTKMTTSTSEIPAATRKIIAVAQEWDAQFYFLLQKHISAPAFSKF